MAYHQHFCRALISLMSVAGLVGGCGDSLDLLESADEIEHDGEEPDADLRATPSEQEQDAAAVRAPAEQQRLTAGELSQLLMGGTYPITHGYAPNGVHAGIDFGGAGDGVTPVKSPVNGTIIDNTEACGKVAVYDGNNTIILAHMTDRTPLGANAKVSIGTVLGKVSDVVGGGCVATGPHLHIEIRRGKDSTMSAPGNDNRTRTHNPLTYGYSPFSPVLLLSPALHSTIAQNSVRFEWAAIQGANSYRLQVNKTPSFNEHTCLPGNCVAEVKTPGTTATRTLAPGTYYWRVRAGNSGQGGQWSAIRSFTKL